MSYKDLLVSHNSDFDISIAFLNSCNFAGDL